MILQHVNSHPKSVPTLVGVQQIRAAFGSCLTDSEDVVSLNMQLGLGVLQDEVVNTEASTTDRLLPDNQTTRQSQLGQTAE